MSQRRGSGDPDVAVDRLARSVCGRGAKARCRSACPGASAGARPPGDLSSQLQEPLSPPVPAVTESAPDWIRPKKVGVGVEEVDVQVDGCCVELESRGGRIEKVHVADVHVPSDATASDAPDATRVPIELLGVTTRRTDFRTHPARRGPRPAGAPSQPGASRSECGGIRSGILGTGLSTGPWIQEVVRQRWFRRGSAPAKAKATPT